MEWNRSGKPNPPRDAGTQMGTNGKEGETAERQRVNALKKVLSDCLKQHVEQIVLVMEEQLRPADDETI